MKQIIDARGKQCPLPVIETKKAIRQMEQGRIEVTVDNEIAVQNLLKMARQMKLEASSVTQAPNCYVVTIVINKGDEIDLSANATEDIIDCAIANDTSNPNETILVVLSADHMGEGNEELGKALMKGFVYALTEADRQPHQVVMYNAGAKLAVEGSDSLEDLRTLEARGVEVFTCGACLNFYELTEKLGVGSITNMYAITEMMMKATKIIRP